MTAPNPTQTRAFSRQANPRVHISLSGIGGLGDAVMLSSVVENMRRAGYRCVVRRSRPGIAAIFSHDPRCTTVARGPAPGELQFRYTYWGVTGEYDFNGHMVQAAFIRNGMRELLTYPECKLFVTEAELALARYRVGWDHFIVYQTETMFTANPKSPEPGEWRRMLRGLRMPLVHVGGRPCGVIAPRVELGGLTTMREWMAIVCAADLVITPDTALNHMASAMGTPAVVVGTGKQDRVGGGQTTQPLSHFRYPSAVGVLPAHGEGKAARYDIDAFADLVRTKFTEASQRPRDRTPYIAQPGQASSYEPDVPYSVARGRRRRQAVAV